MKVSFIIPLYNCLPLSQAMLASLRATLPPGLPHEIILVDDGSTDGTRAWLAGLAQPAVGPSNLRASAPCCYVLNEHNLGFAATCNRGAAVATGEFLFFLNNDLVLLPFWFEPMLATFGGLPRAGLVGNVQLNFATGAVDHAGVFFTHQGKPAHATTRWLGLVPRREVAAVTGACLALRHADWRRLGGFDEEYRNGCEDIDLALRAAAAGLANVVALRSVVRHHVSASFGRKLRDEHNTRRLVGRWRETIARLAARDWSRRWIAAHAEQSGAFDYPAAAAILQHYLLDTPPPAVVRQGVAAAMAVEWRRWSELLDGTPPPPVAPAGRTDEI